MKKMFLTPVASVLLITGCSQKETVTEAEAINVITRFDAAWKNKNTAAADSVLAEKYIYFTQSGGTFGRTSLLQTARSEEYKLSVLQRRIISIQIQGNTAIVNTIWKGNGQYRGEPFNDTQRCSITIVKNRGRIEILSEHCTLLK